MIQKILIENLSKFFTKIFGRFILIIKKHTLKFSQPKNSKMTFIWSNFKQK